MPSATFYNLPEEKRQRLIEAAWEELTSVSFDKVSINRIIQRANISRGSFYQYFADKTDLLDFLLGQVCENMEEALWQREKLQEEDLFAAALTGYDWVMERREDADLRLPQMIRLAQLNPAMDLSSGMAVAQQSGNSVQEVVLGANFWQQGDVTLEDHLELLFDVVGNAVLSSFRSPETAGAIRTRLKKQLMILKRGMLERTAKGELE